MHTVFLFGLSTIPLTTGIFILMIICVLAVCFFEFINGFHDTANAVATVIYTNSLQPTQAVVLSGIFNFFGVILGGLGVAMGILKLLPLTDLMYASLGTNIAFLLAVLISAILWNLGTWYFGIPASSSHTLIGALIGASLVFSAISDEQTTKAYEVFTFLLITPLFGFFISWLLLGLMKKVFKEKSIYQSPKGNQKPPFGIRLLTVLGCVGISFTHGSNDGQKGVGLLMVVLIAFLPAYFALHPDFDKMIAESSLKELSMILEVQSDDKEFNRLSKVAQEDIADGLISLQQLPAGKLNPQKLKKEQILDVRRVFKNKLPKHCKALTNYVNTKNIMGKEKFEKLKKMSQKWPDYTDHAPTWTIMLISLCLGIGTMIGWKRVVETIGEKIGKTAFDYSQGLVSQLVSAGTIFASTYFKLPVSTTHIVSSSVMGTMFSKGGRANIQKKTITNIFLAWVLTLPVSIGLSAALFYIFKFIFV